MLHNYVKNDDLDGRYYGVSSNEVWVLVQLDDGSNQVRINISPDQALHMADLLTKHAKKVLHPS